MNTVGLLVKLETKPGREDELASFLTGALPLVQQEPDDRMVRHPAQPSAVRHLRRLPERRGA